MMADDPRIAPGEGGLPRILLSSADGGRAEIYLQGAHVARWTAPDGDDVLFLSPRSKFAPGEAIRGGIPVIFPQFADQGPLPKHGFARTARWTLEDATEDAAVLVLADTPETRAIWNHAFRAELRVSIADGLTTTLSIHNTGDGPFDFTCALHSYFRVRDITSVSIHGLQGLAYRDKVAGGDGVQAEETLRFAGETDRIYIAAPDDLTVADGPSRQIRIHKRGFPDAVVWNPWAGKARGMGDLGEDQYSRFVCVEAACAAEPVRLEPGASWKGGQTIRIS